MTRAPQVHPGAPDVEARADAAVATALRVAAFPPDDGGIGAVHPLTPMQEGMLLHARVAPGSGIDLVQYVFTLRGSVDAAALRRAWEHVLGRHPALRTAFDWSGGERPRQAVHRAVALPWEEADWRPLPPPGRDGRLAAWLGGDRTRGFDPAAPPLLRVLLARVGDDAWRMVWTHHHLLLDGWSAPLVLGEVLSGYGALVRGEPPALPQRRPFGDYVAWLEGRDPARTEAFWREELAGLGGPTPLPPGLSGGEEDGDGVLEARLSAVLTAQIRSLARRLGVTPGTLAQGAWALVLAGCSGEDDVVFGAAVSGRPAQLEGVEEMVGMFVNTVPVRLRLSPGVPAAAWLAELQSSAAAASEHEHAPLAEVRRWAGVDPREPLFRTLLAVENYPVDEAAQARAGFAVELDEVVSRTGFPLTLTVILGARMRVRLRWDGARYGRGDAERILGWFRSALEAVARAPDAPLHAVSFLTDDERRRVVEEWNRTGTRVPRELCVHELFARQAARTPDATAVAFGAQRLTYAQLHAAANRLARALRRRGVGPEVRVAVCLERGVDAVCALLGVLAAGGVFVPLDPGHPPERLAEVLDDSDAAVLVTRGRLAAGLPPVGARVLCPDAARDEIAAEADEAPTAGAGPGNLAYVIYTSGSTGRPKGVMVEHRSVVNLAALLDHAVYHAWEGAPPPAVSLNGPLTFDTSVKQWVRLLTGSALHVIPDEVRPDGRALAAYVREHRIGVLDCTPAQLRLLLSAGLDGVRDGFPADVLVAGEAIDEATWRRLQASTGPRFHNLYGPTECTVDAAVSPVHGDSPVPVIGRPGANVRLYVVDPWRRPVPVGVPGELWIGGAGVARGYLGHPAATADRFVPDPFGGEPGARLYRTGDRARWLPSGRVEFLSRLDHQVKIRGVRIEPGEVEAALLRGPGVREAVVVAREDEPGERRLVAYVAGEGVEAETLRDRLRSLLPSPMLPSAIVALDALPRNRHGKVDRAALPAPERPAAGEGWLPPRTPAEAAVAAVWEEVLNTGPVGARDDFFALGGHSLHAARVASRLREALGVELPLRACFEARTVAELARAMEAAAREGGAEAAAPLVPVPRDGELPLSFAQARLWYLHQLDPAGTAYHMATALRLRGELDRDALRRSLGDLVRRHEALRTVFPAPGGKPVQAIRPPAPVALPLVELGGVEPAAREAELRRLVRAEAARPFDLARGPLLRATLVRLGERDHAILFTLHHIVSDGWSTAILVREVSRLYAAHREGAEPGFPPLPVQYADYAVWQRERLRGGALEGQLAWWRGALAGAPPLLELPTDRPRPPVQGSRGGSVPFALAPEAARALRAEARGAGATPFMALLAAWQALLARYAGDDDVLVGMPVAGRTRLEVEGLIGLFVNTLVVRADLSGAPGFRALLARTRTRVLEAHAHQELPFERLVDALNVERSQAHAPLFQVMLTLLDAPEGGAVPDFAGVEVEALPPAAAAPKFDLVFSLADTGERLHGELTYRADLWDRPTIERLLGHFSALVAGVLAAPGAPFGAVPLLGPGERERVVREWNDTGRPFPAQATLAGLFVEQARRTPGRVAVADHAGTLTYAELDAHSNRLARHLGRLGVGAETRVAVSMERTRALAAAVLAVWKAGAVYVPVDPAYPPERRAWMLADSGAALVLADAASAVSLPLGAAPVVVDRLELAGEDPSAPGVAVDPGSLAYVIYTSGSTGWPKGVMVPHRPAVNFLCAMRDRLGIGPDDVVAAVASPSFDPSVMDLLLPLTVGARVVLATRDQALDPGLLAALLEQSGATLLQATPATWRLLVQHGWRGNAGLALLSGGEALHPDLARELLARGRGLWNLYGPTEATVWSAVHRVDHAERVRLGQPIANLRYYVADPGPGVNPAPLGVPGELLIGGEGVTRGYLGRPALTAAHFVPDPFSERAGARLYRTGDRVRRGADGTLEFLGRIDFQVKVRGFRIELGEIEAALGDVPGVRQAVAVAREHAPGDTRIVAYLVAEGARPAPQALREALARRLPEHMLPAAYVAMDALPLNPNGKVNRRALPEPRWGGDEQGYQAPRTALEHLLARVWADVLRVERVGVHDRFFDLGGDSVLSIQVVARARGEGVALTARQMVEHPTIARLARVAEAAAPVPAADDALDGEAPLTPVQHWFLGLDACGRGHRNRALLLAPRRPLAPEPLARALERLRDHHPALRLRLVRGRDGAWVQRFAGPGGPAPLACVDLSGLAEADRAARMETAAAALQAGLDLERGPLLRAARFDLGAGAGRLLLVAHPLAVDGGSWRVLLDDLQRLCEQAERGEAASLPPGTASLDRWARRLAEHAASGAHRDEVEHWTAPARRGVPPLPVDHPGGENRAASAAHMDVALGQEETEALLHDAPSAYGMEAGDLLLAALARCVGEWTGERRVLVHLEGDGRAEPLPGVDVSRTVGCFTALFPVVLDLRGARGEAEELKAVKEQLRAVPSRGAGYGILRYLSPDDRVRRALEALPEPEIRFSWPGPVDATLPEPALFAPAGGPAGPPHVSAARRPHLLEVAGAVENGVLRVRWSYARDVHRPATVRALAERWLAALRALAAHCRSAGAGGYTPSDFPLAGLDEETLAMLEAHFA